MSDTQGASFYLDKLVRDGIAADMVSRGEHPQVSQVQGVDLLNALIKKIQEEAAELDPLSDDLLKELADLSEAIRQTAIQKGWHVDDVERARIERYEKMGGFEGGQYVGRLDLPPGDPWIEYYRKDPIRFPEIKSRWSDLGF
jgi:predicted house-cleaning noncanonical NTP pyrophosphatase (MazG superfamily)